MNQILPISKGEESSDRPMLKNQEMFAKKYSVSSLYSQNQNETTSQTTRDSNFALPSTNREAEDPNSIFREVPLCISSSTLLQRSVNCLDILGELEGNTFTMVNQLSLYKLSPKKTAKSSESLQLKIDFERKRDILCQHYKGILARNLDIEKTIDRYKSAMLRKKKIDYDPNELSRKGEEYVEGVTVKSLLRRFAMLIDPLFRRQNYRLFESKSTRSFSENRCHITMNRAQSHHQIHHPRTANSNALVEKPSNSTASTEPNDKEEFTASRCHTDQGNGEQISMRSSPIKVVVIQNKTDNTKTESMRRFQTPEKASVETRQKLDLCVVKLDGFALESEKNRAALLIENINRKKSPKKLKGRFLRSVFNKKAGGAGMNRSKSEFAKLAVNGDNEKSGENLLSGPYAAIIGERAVVTDKGKKETKTAMNADSANMVTELLGAYTLTNQSQVKQEFRISPQKVRKA